MLEKTNVGEIEVALKECDYVFSKNDKGIGKALIVSGDALTVI